MRSKIRRVLASPRKLTAHGDPATRIWSARPAAFVELRNFAAYNAHDAVYSGPMPLMNRGAPAPPGGLFFSSYRPPATAPKSGPRLWARRTGSISRYATARNCFCAGTASRLCARVCECPGLLPAGDRRRQHQIRRRPPALLWANTSRITDRPSPAAQPSTVLPHRPPSPDPEQKAGGDAEAPPCAVL